MYKVIKNFIDKESNNRHYVGAEYKPSSRKRGEELVDLGYVKEIKKTKPVKGDDAK